MGYFSEEDITNKEKESYEDTTAPATRSGKVTNSRYVNVRKSASKTGEVLGQLPKDTVATILGESGDYYQVKYRNYPKAYVAKHFIEEIKND